MLYLHSPLWRLRRRIWILRAGGRCQRCGSRRRLTIHHRTYQRLGHERRADVTVLCWNCHRRHHNTTRRSRWHPGRSDSDLRTTRGPGDTARRASARGSPSHLALLALIALPTLIVAAALLAKR